MLDLAAQLAEGLAAAHAKGIVHRDLNPSNLFITREGRLKILDFGIAKLLQSAEARTESGAILGTPSYMSPEQAQRRPADARSDVFSFGAVLYEMLSGAPPFERESPVQTAYAIVHDEAAEYVDGYQLALVRVQLGDKQAALRWLETAWRQHSALPVVPVQPNRSG